MNTVYVVNEPMKWSREHNRHTFAVDLRPAERFGKLVTLTQAGEPSDDCEEWMPLLREYLNKFNSLTDYLLPVGHPMLIAAAAGYLGTRGHTFMRILKWSRTARDYIPLAITLVTPKENQIRPTTPKEKAEQ